MRSKDAIKADLNAKQAEITALNEKQAKLQSDYNESKARALDLNKRHFQSNRPPATINVLKEQVGKIVVELELLSDLETSFKADLEALKLELKAAEDAQALSRCAEMAGEYRAALEDARAISEEVQASLGELPGRLAPILERIMANAPEQAIKAAPAGLKAEGYRLIEKQTAALPSIKVDMGKSLEALAVIESRKTHQVGYLTHILRPECLGTSSNGTPTPPQAPSENLPFIPAHVLRDPQLARELGFLIRIGGKEVWTTRPQTRGEMQQRAEAQQNQNAAKQ